MKWKELDLHHMLLNAMLPRAEEKNGETKTENMIRKEQVKMKKILRNKGKEEQEENDLQKNSSCCRGIRKVVGITEDIFFLFLSENLLG